MIRKFSVLLYKDSYKKSITPLIVSNLTTFGTVITALTFFSGPFTVMHYAIINGIIIAEVASLLKIKKISTEIVEEISLDNNKLTIKFPNSTRTIEQSDLRVEPASPVPNDFKHFKPFDAKGNMLISYNGTVINQELFEKYFGKLTISQ